MVASELTGQRGEVVERMAHVETLVSAIIAKHYFKGNGPALYEPFLLEVLYDDYFSLGLKINILQKISPQLRAGEPSVIDRLRKMSKIRNHYAHRVIEICEIGQAEGRVPNPSNHHKSIDFKDLYQKFREHEVPVWAGLKEAFCSEGGEIDRDPPPFSTAPLAPVVSRFLHRLRITRPIAPPPSRFSQGVRSIAAPAEADFFRINASGSQNGVGSCLPSASSSHPTFFGIAVVPAPGGRLRPDTNPSP